MKKGFTLIELLIVVAIIGILASIAIPQLIDYVQRSRCTRSEADANTIAGALGNYYTDFGQFPDTGLANLIGSLEAAHIEKVPPTDAWSRDWDYTAIADGGVANQRYSLASLARDGIAGPYRIKDQIAPDDPFRHDYDVVIFTGMFSSNCK